MATKNESAAIQALGKKWAERKKAGASQSELDSIHKQAQALRQKEGYTANSRGENHTSTKTSSNSNKNASAYTPKGTYHDADLSGNALTQMNQYKQQWADAKNAGDTEGMSAAHAAAEALRKQFGYSGGSDGSDYIGFPQEEAFSIPTFDYTQQRPMYQEEDYGKRPTYESDYREDIDALMQSILNRDKFAYDIEQDPLYAQYKSQYLREGTRAMNDTLASAAAGAGGMNSYAINAAQQANNYYNAQLGDKIPELYQLAYGMYLDDIDGKVRDLGLLEKMDNTQYAQYRDTMSDWANDRDFAYNKYRDNVGDWESDRNFAYGSYRDAMSDYFNNRDYQYGVSRDEVADQRYDFEPAYERAMKFMADGIMPSVDILRAAGISDSEARAYINRVNAANVLSSGRRTDGGTTRKKVDPETEDDGGDGEPEVDQESVLSLGYGPISQDRLAELEEAGLIESYIANGKVYFHRLATDRDFVNPILLNR